MIPGILKLRDKLQAIDRDMVLDAILTGWLSEVSYLWECGGMKEQPLYASNIASLYSIICRESKISLVEE